MTFAEKFAQAKAAKPTVEQWLESRLTLVREQRVWLRRTFPAKGKAPGVSALCCSRGQGKTTLGAALLSAALDPRGPLFRAGCENVLMAGSFDQARFLFSALRQFLPGNAYRWADSLSQMRVRHLDTGTACRVISSRGKTALGIRDARLIVGDEPASWDARNGALMFDAVVTSAGKTQQTAIFLGTLSPCDNPDSWWPKLVDGGSEPGTHVSLLQGPETWPVTWSQVAKCNPLVRISKLMKDTLRGELRKALNDPRKRRVFRAYRLNVLTASDDREVLIELPEWKTVLARPVPEREGRPVLAIDTGESRSMSAVVALYPNGRCEAIARLPGLPSIEEQEARDTVEPGTYQRLVSAGVLSVDGSRHVVDVGSFVDDVLERFDSPWVIVCDRHKLGLVKDAVGGRCGVVPRVPKYAESTEDIDATRRLVLDGCLSIAQDTRAILSLAISESLVEHDGAGNKRIVKRRQTRSRDDLAQALIQACGFALRENPDLARADDGDDEDEDDLQQPSVEALP